MNTDKAVDPKVLAVADQFQKSKHIDGHRVYHFGLVLQIWHKSYLADGQFVKGEVVTELHSSLVPINTVDTLIKELETDLEHRQRENPTISSTQVLNLFKIDVD